MTMTTTPAASAPVRVPADVLRPWAARMLQAGGMSADNAAQVADALVWADLRGTGSHGVSRLPLYLQWLASGEMAGHAEPRTMTRLPALVVIDGQGGAGAVGMHSVVDAVVDGAKKAGACVGLLKATTHTGALGYFTSHIARQGMVGLAMAASGPLMAYHGAAESGLSTAPLSIAAPGASADAAPILFDMASSAVAMGKLMQARAAGKPLEAGWAIDAQGRPTLDATAALAGAMLTFGGHKGSALSTMVELMAGALIGDLNSQGSMDFDSGKGGAPYHGHLLLAFDPQRFAGDEWPASQERAEAMFAAITDQGARLPSERRFAARAQSAKHGISVPRGLFNDVEALLKN